MKPGLVVSLSVFLLAACATGPDYKEARNKSSSGYSEQVLDTDRYRVTYKLKDDNIGLAQDLVLLRASELTLEKGYKYFKTISRDTETSKERTRDSWHRTGPDYVVTRDCGLIGCRDTAYPVYRRDGLGTYTTREETIVAIEILMSDTRKAESYDAANLAANIRSRLD